MDKRYYYLIIFLLLLGVFFIYITLSNNKESVKENENPDLMIDFQLQNKKERIINRSNIKLEKFINLEKLKIFRPASVKTDFQGNIYVLDISSPKIAVFSRDGSLISEIGKGKGQGPGELINPTDFSFDDNNNLWVVDPGQNRIVIFDIKNNILNHIKMIKPGYRIAVINNYKYIIIPFNNNELFAVYDNDIEINSFGNIIMQQEKFSILLSGLLSKDRTNNLYFTTDRSSLLLSYNHKGDLRFAVKTIEDLEPLPKLKEFNNQVMRLPDTFTSLSLSIKEDRIYILNRYDLGKQKSSYIDIYNNKNGQYIFTLMIPAKIYSCDIKSNNIYAINDTALLIYNIQDSF